MATRSVWSLTRKITKIMARLTKFEIGCLIESLPGNTPWSSSSLASMQSDYFTRREMVDWYNRLVIERGLDLVLIS